LFTPRGEHGLLFRRIEGRTEGLHPQRINSTLGDKFTPIEDKFHRWSKTKNCFDLSIF
jgi:hypothetical protein